MLALAQHAESAAPMLVHHIHMNRCRLSMRWDAALVMLAVKMLEMPINSDMAGSGVIGI